MKSETSSPIVFKVWAESASSSPLGLTLTQSDSGQNPYFYPARKRVKSTLFDDDPMTQTRKYWSYLCHKCEQCVGELLKSS